MKKTYLKLILQGVRKTRARFISILTISAIGVGFLGGLLATTPDMQYTADKYYDDKNMFDVDIKGSLGLTDDDVAALKNLDYVENAMGARVTDVTMQNSDGSLVTRIYGMPINLNGSNALINGFELVEGRMPQNSGECLICIPNGYMNEHGLGKTYTISSDNKDYDKLADTYKFSSLTAVGVVNSPYYISMESEPSTVGTGKISLIMFVFPECYSLDVYTDIFVTLSGAKSLDSFGEEYLSLVNDKTALLETVGQERSVVRRSEIVSEATEKLDDARRDYDEAKSDADKELADARRKLNDGYADLEQAKLDILHTANSLNDNTAALSASEGELSANIAAQRANNDAAYGAGLIDAATYSANAAQIDAVEMESLNKINAGKAAIASAWDTLNVAQNIDIPNAQTELEKAERKYSDAKATADEKLADAFEKIEDAQKEIDDIEVPEWFLFSREDTVGYNSYKSNSEKIGAIAKVFPIFFFFVAALVALTTMTRMVEEERAQIGTLKALGYTNGAIAFYYVGYSVLASLLGSAFGILLGMKLLPAVISNAYSMMFTLPKTETIFWWKYAVVISLIAIFCTTAATLFACLGQLSEKPASLMLARAPKAGKRVLLERITFIWKRLSFIHKVTARNIFRYKKRFYMTVIGIAGCCALLVTGFGLRDSIHDIVDKQFGEIYKYNLSIYLKDDAAPESEGIIGDFLSDKNTVLSYAVIHSETASVSFGGATEKVTLQAPRITNELKEHLNLRERISGEDIPFNESSVVLTEKLCDTLGIKVGDRVSIKTNDGQSNEFTVSGISENYVTSYVFMSAKNYENSFGAPPDYKLILVRIADESPSARDEISKTVLKSDDILLLQFSQTIRESFGNTVKNIDYIVVVLIISAGILAVIVLYNLININICERTKELATIKVLGFHEREVASYIYRETNILCVIGTLVGFGFGVWLHSFVVKTAEVDAVMFGRSIYPQSFLFAALVTFFFTFVVDMIMLKKLKSIDIVESMKANE